MTGPNAPVAEPDPRLKLTDNPPEVSWLPAESRAVNVTVAEPPDWIVPGVTATDD